MKRRIKQTISVLLAFAMFICPFIGACTVSNANEDASGYGFTSNNASGKISQLDDGVRISGKEAAAGILFDYTYDTPLSVTDMNVSYKLTTDTTRGSGAHSRMNIYILPEKDSEITEGIRIQLLHSVYDDDETKFIVTGVEEDSVGWEYPSYFTDDYSVEMRIFTEGENAFAIFNGARYQFKNSEDINKIFKMQDSGKAYLRITAHFGENGESALGYDLDIRSIDNVSFGKSTVNDTSFLSTKVSDAAETKEAITKEGIVISGKFAEGCGVAAKYSMGSEHTVKSGDLSSFGITLDVSGVDLSVKKFIEISFTNILDNSDRMDAWDSFGDAGDQPTIYAATYRLFITPNEIVTAIMKTANEAETQGLMNIAGGANVLDNKPHYKFSSFIPRDDGVLTFAVARIQGDWKILVNGASIGFESDINELMDKLNSKDLEVTVNLGSDDAANYYASVGSAPTDVVKITGVNGKTFSDPYDGVYDDEIVGENEFVRTQFVNIAPDTASAKYTLTADGLSVFGRNDASGFAAGIGYTESVWLDHDMEYTFTVKMPEDVYASDGTRHGYYCFFLGDSTNKNFSEMRSIYLRVSYESSDVTVKSASTAFKTEAIMWDNQLEAPVVASSSIYAAPKTTEGKESEITFRFVYVESEQVYKIFANGQKVSSDELEKAITSYIDDVVDELYFACTFDYSLEGKTQGAWTDDKQADIGATIVSFSGCKIVNKQPDVQNTITLNEGQNITSDSVTLSWTKGVYEDGDFDSDYFTPNGYKIVRSIGVKNGDAVEPREDKIIYIDGIDTLEFTDTELLPDTAYYYTVYAVQKNDDGTYTELLSSNINKRVVTSAEKDTDTGDNSEVEDPNGKNSSIVIGISIAVGAALVIAIVVGVIILNKKKKAKTN